MSKRVIQTENAPKAIGPYSQGIVTQNARLIFSAGQISIDPESGEVVGSDIAAQTRQVLKNLTAVLKAAGSSVEQVVKTTVYMKNMADFNVMNEVYASFFKNNPPARSAVEVSRLPRDVLIEIECVAEVL